MTTECKYVFSFSRFQLDLPYTNVALNLYSPWTYFIAYGSCLLYLFLITIVFPILSSKVTMNWKNSFSKIHFKLLFLYSLFAFLAGFYHIIKTGEIINWSNYLCTPIPPWLRIVSISFTLSKLWEWLDTAILIWKGQNLKKIGFLHVYHHATTFFLFLLVMNFPGAEKSGLLFNGFVHTLMYYHFAYRLPKFVRPFITTLQIIQLIAVIYIWCIVPTMCTTYKNVPKENVVEFYFPCAFVPVYCALFLKFFVEQYILPPSTSKIKLVRKVE